MKSLKHLLRAEKTQLLTRCCSRNQEMKRDEVDPEGRVRRLKEDGNYQLES